MPSRAVSAPSSTSPGDAGELGEAGEVDARARWGRMRRVRSSSSGPIIRRIEVGVAETRAGMLSRSAQRATDSSSSVRGHAVGGKSLGEHGEEDGAVGAVGQRGAEFVRGGLRRRGRWSDRSACPGAQRWRSWATSGTDGAGRGAARRRSERFRTRVVRGGAAGLRRRRGRRRVLAGFIMPAGINRLIRSARERWTRAKTAGVNRSGIRSHRLTHSMRHGRGPWGGRGIRRVRTVSVRARG